MRMPSGYLQGEANLKTGRYYNTQPTVTSHYPQEISTVHDTKDTRRQPHTNSDTYQGHMRLVKSETLLLDLMLIN